MTLRTTSATRRTVVSRSSDVANTSATSSSSDSTGKRSGLESTEPILRMIAAAFRLPLKAKTQRLKSGVVSLISPRSTDAALASRHHANIGKIAIFLRVVEAVADYKFLNLESNVVAFQRKLAPRRLVEQGRD